MNEYDVDLHIHSRYSIGVSKNMTIPNIAVGAKQKGLEIVGTGDATQPDWLKHLKATLRNRDGTLEYNGMHYALTVEIEDSESIHHVVIMPDFDSIDSLRQSLRNSSENLDHKWGGRPRVNMNGERLAGIVRDLGGLVGPAHAFTPFRSIFRENKYNDLKQCYGSETGHIHFIELGLSADSELADHIPSIRDLTFITSSDAHSPSPAKIGRELVRFRMEDPSFSELKKAILRKGGRGPVLNIGLDPRLGKYYLSFCPSCRRTIIFEEGEGSPQFDELNIYISYKDKNDLSNILKSIHSRKVFCPVDGRPLRLGVRDRARMIGNPSSESPPHRPPYLHIPPLLDLIADAMKIKSRSSKRVWNIYNTLRERLGSEIEILTGAKINEISSIESSVAMMIDAYRNDKVGYIPGGGGRYGRLVMEE